MKKTFQLEDLECAHCAAKMEKAISSIDGVVRASVHFITSNLMVEAPEEIFDSVMTQAAKAVKKIEPDCKIKGL